MCFAGVITLSACVVDDRHERDIRYTADTVVRPLGACVAGPPARSRSTRPREGKVSGSRHGLRRLPRRGPRACRTGAVETGTSKCGRRQRSGRSTRRPRLRPPYCACCCHGPPPSCEMSSRIALPHRPACIVQQHLRNPALDFRQRARLPSGSVPPEEPAVNNGASKITRLSKMFCVEARCLLSRFPEQR